MRKDGQRGAKSAQKRESGGNQHGHAKAGDERFIQGVLQPLMAAAHPGPLGAPRITPSSQAAGPKLIT